MITVPQVLVKPSHDLPLFYGESVLDRNARRPWGVLKAEIARQGETASDQADAPPPWRADRSASPVRWWHRAWISRRVKTVP